MLASINISTKHKSSLDHQNERSQINIVTQECNNAIKQLHYEAQNKVEEITKSNSHIDNKALHYSRYGISKKLLHAAKNVTLLLALLLIFSTITKTILMTCLFTKDS